MTTHYCYNDEHNNHADASKFRDVVFEDVLFDKSRCCLILYIGFT